jgi:hypothetical protein
MKSMEDEPLSVASFSPHLFWDIDVEKFEVNSNRQLVVQRVLEYGLIGDWRMIQKHWGIEEIARHAKGLRSLDDRALSFISTMSKIPKEQFRCYSTRR